MQIFTFLYTDIEGSTRLWEHHPTAIQAAVSRHETILRDAIANHGGSVFRTVGDGLCAVFANATHAVQAALDAQIALHAETWGETGPLRVRMAILTGEAEAHRGDYSGSSLNRIGRLLGLVHGGQIVISQATQLLVRDALPPGTGLKDLGEVGLRDLSHSEHVFQVTHPDLPSDFPPIASSDRQTNNLPSHPTAMIGRETELAEVLKRLSSETVRMLTLTGPGGTGKTRLGLQAAADLSDRFEHGVYFVDLAPIRVPEGVLPVIARALGIRETSYRPLMQELKDQLKAREILLLLDNLEQVISAGPLLVELLQDCPNLKMLVTSREPLNVRGEHIYPVPPLSLPVREFKHHTLENLTQYEAVRLFIERAQAVKPGFQVTNENAPAVAEICVRLDGLPLAIELAASRIRLFPPQALLEKLESSLRLLKGGARDLPARQQTLRDTIGWSYDLLDSAGQNLFKLLAVFPGGGAFESIEAVAGRVARQELLNLDVIDGLSSLVDKSLVRQVDSLVGDPRFVMLETIREYAAERLEEDAELKADSQRSHAVYFADFTQRQWGRLSQDNEQELLKEMEAEIENLRAAWRYWVAGSDLEQLGKFIDGLWMFYETRGWYHAILVLTTDLLDVLTKTPSTPERARQEIVLQTSLASALLATKGYVSNEVERAYTRALELIEQQGEIPQLLPVLQGLSRYYSYRGDFDKSIRVGEHTLSLANKLDDADMRVVGHLILGTNTTFSKSLRLGLEHFEKGIESYVPKQRGSRRFRFGTDPGVACHITSAISFWMLGLPDKALKRAIDTVNLTRQLNHPYSQAYALFHTGLLHLWTYEIELSEKYSHELNALAERYDFPIWIAVGTCLHGAAQAGLGRAEQGLEQIQWGMNVYQGLNTPPIFWTMLVFNLAQAYLVTGRPEDGLARLSEIMDSVSSTEAGALGAEFCRLRADLLLAVAKENAAEAEGWLRQALEIAKGQQARLLELRAAVSLGRLWLEQGKGEQSRKLLGGVYESMTEGFKMRDMKEARELLELV
jgi:predicted ATPase/class 3 adenylate cyclase